MSAQPCFVLNWLVIFPTCQPSAWCLPHPSTCALCRAMHSIIRCVWSVHNASYSVCILKHPCLKFTSVHPHPSLRKGAPNINHTCLKCLFGSTTLQNHWDKSIDKVRTINVWSHSVMSAHLRHFANYKRANVLRVRGMSNRLCHCQDDFVLLEPIVLTVHSIY